MMKKALPMLVVLIFGLSDTAYTWTVVVGNQIVFFLVCFAFTRVKKVSLAALTGVKRPPRPYFFPIFIAIAVACVFAFAPIAALFSKFMRFLGYQYAPQYFVPYDNAGLFVLALLGLSLLPALGEETMIRGVLLSGARERGPLFAILFSSLIFALFHGNLVQLAHQFMLGCVMGYLVVLTGSIWPSAVMHAVNNGCALLIEFFYARDIIGTGAYGYFTANFETCSGGAFAGVLVASWVVLFALLAGYTLLVRRERLASGDPSEGKGVDAFLRRLSPRSELSPGGEVGAYERFAPAALVGVLVVLLVSNLLAEVLL